MTQHILSSIKNDHAYFQSLYYKTPKKGIDPALEIGRRNPIPSGPVLFDSLNVSQKARAISLAQAKLRRKNQNLDSQKDYLKTVDRDMNSYWIEFHRKFALTATIIVLFLIGAPLGAIVRKGGFGAPVVIAALLFMIYFVLISVGESLTNSEVVSPFLGMWFATMILTPIALILLRAASNDAPVFNRENWAIIFRRIKKKNATAVSHQ